MQAEDLMGGFADVSRDSALAFRAAMNAMARPGRIHQIAGATPPEGLSTAAGTLALTLCDGETPVFLAPSHDREDLRRWLTFHASVRFVASAQCSFAIGAWDDLAAITDFPIGTPEYPDRSATLIAEVPALTATGARLTGPGIQSEVTLSLPDTTLFQRQAGLFPLGLDVFLTCGSQLAAVPRSTKVEAA